MIISIGESVHSNPIIIHKVLLDFDCPCISQLSTTKLRIKFVFIRFKKQPDFKDLELSPSIQESLEKLVVYQQSEDEALKYVIDTRKMEEINIPAIIANKESLLRCNSYSKGKPGRAYS